MKNSREKLNELLNSFKVIEKWQDPAESIQYIGKLLKFNLHQIGKSNVLKIRLDNDEDFEPLSEKLKRIIAQKRNGTLAGIRLFEELEKLPKEFVALAEESKRPIRESIAKAALKEALYLLDEESAFEIADAVLLKADELCFENWFSKEEMNTTLYREFTILLAQGFNKYELHKKGKLFIDRTMKLLKKARFSGTEKGN